MSNPSNGNQTTALVPAVPAAVQTRAMAVSQEQAQAMLPAINALWPTEVKANPNIAALVARVSIAYGLDPMMGELIILGGKLYVTYEGRLRKAMEHEQYGGLECRPATEEERAAFRCTETDHLWRCEVYRLDWKKPVVGWGRVTAADGNPVARQHPQNVAEKRAKARAFRDAFSIPLPSAEEDADYAPSSQRYVNAETGEITDTRPGGLLATRGQIAAVHVLSKEVELSEDERHSYLQRQFGKGSTGELTEGEAATFLEWLGQIAEDRESSKPEVIEARSRDAAPLQTPKAASPRYHTPQPQAAPEEAPPIVEAEVVEMAPPGPAEPPVVSMEEWVNALMLADITDLGDNRPTEFARAQSRMQAAGLADADAKLLCLRLHQLSGGGNLAPGTYLRDVMDGRLIVALTQADDATIRALAGQEG